MSLDRDIFLLLNHHFKNGADVSEVLAILSNHITMIIQSFPSGKDGKISLAKQCLECVIEEIEKDPNPMARRLN